MIAKNLSNKLIPLLKNDPRLLIVANTVYKEVNCIESCAYYGELLKPEERKLLSTKNLLAVLLRVNKIATAVVSEQDKIATIAKFAPQPHMAHTNKITGS
jgi:hypothetical protein